MTTKIPPELVNKEIFNNRRLNINGGMDVAQRGTLTGLTSAYGGPDRYQIASSNLGVYSLAQSTDSPDGFANSLLLSCTTADASPSANDYAVIAYGFEGFDLQTLKFGTSDAEQITVSFYVKTNKTGTYNLELYAPDNSGGPAAGKQYTVSSANTWEKKIITFPCGNSAAIPDDNTAGIYLQFWLAGGSTFTSGSASDGNFHSTTANRAAGQVNFADSTSNTFQLTGVQVETGDTATPFEYRSFGEELALCQRYYYRLVSGTEGSNYRFATGAAISTTQMDTHFQFQPQMRGTPSLDAMTAGNYRTNYDQDATNIFIVHATRTGTCVRTTHGSTQAQGFALFLNPSDFSGHTNTDAAYIAFEAEL